MSIRQLHTVTETTARIRIEINELASTLPEYDLVMSMNDIGKALRLQITADIGDVSRFTHGEAITSFANVDSDVNESGISTTEK